MVCFETVAAPPLTMIPSSSGLGWGDELLFHLGLPTILFCPAPPPQIDRGPQVSLAASESPIAAPNELPQHGNAKKKHRKEKPTLDIQPEFATFHV